MKNVLSVFASAIVLLFAVAAAAADKVVVVPLGSGAKGTDGQVQYNDAGKTAGADVWYEKTTGKLEVAGEVRTVDGSANPRLWGKGRPGTVLRGHTDPNGYCTTSTGINFALSKHMANWASAADVCPVGTWVCSLNDLSPLSACPVQPFTGYYAINADGTGVPPSATAITAANNVGGWLADAGNSETDGLALGSAPPFSGGFAVSSFLRTWCCWQ